MVEEVEKAEDKGKGTDGQETVRVDAQSFTVEQQKLFTEGWKAAGGYMGDIKTESPLFAPWSRDECIDVVGDDPVRWGRDYWDWRKEELANAALLEAFDSPRGSIAASFMHSSVMSSRPAQYLYGTLHDTVTPAFEASVMLEPLRIFSVAQLAASEEQLARLSPADLEGFAEMCGVHLDRAMLYRFNDGSHLLRDEDNYWCLTDEEAKNLTKKLAEL